ncbi:UPF0547 protein C16orf87 homolog isoform X1 [Myotis lucifugus]|uniref:UPF0547 protein C16orf87 homolog isoform X1 n=1 Tax=Myotis lucifugus TaxID=59463 RepID=UPI000CCC253D|nr:UPF0547 protein C16orf87 homolog isoform X1 [Myotis lucifugus]
MSASRAKKVKMATKSCPECDLQVPVACKSCPCGYIFISRKLLNAKHPEKSPPSTENKHEAKRRRTERARREKMHPTGHKDLENRKRSRSNSHSDHSRRGRGRPKSASAKKHEEERECVDSFFEIASAKPQTAVDSRERSEASGRAGDGFLCHRTCATLGEQSCGLGCSGVSLVPKEYCQCFVFGM